MSRRDNKDNIVQVIVGIIQILACLPLEFFKLIGSIFKE